MKTEVQIANGVSDGRARAEAIIAKLDVEIENKEQELEDEVGPTEKIEAEIQDMKFAMEAAEAGDAARIKREALTYAKSLKLLTRNPEALREWENIFENKYEGAVDPDEEPLAAVA